MGNGYVAGFVSLSILCGLIHAQIADSGKAASIFRADSELVLIPAFVTDRDGHTIVDLLPEDFALEEDGRAQEILSVSRWEAPAAIGVIFDASGSMTKHIGNGKLAIRILLDDARPEDETFLITFSDSPRVVVESKSDPLQISANVLSLRAQGGTALFDAIYLGLQQIRKTRCPHKVLVIVTDCGDNHSRYSFAEVLAAARESDVQVYTLGVMASSAYRDSKRGRWQLEELARRTGGSFISVRSMPRIGEDVERLNALVRNQFLIAYRSDNRAIDEKWRRVRVRVRAPKTSSYKVSAKSGYYVASRRW